MDHVTEKQLYEVTIAGLRFKLRSAHDQKTVDKLTQIVRDKFESVQHHHKQISSQNALMLTALHLAEDLISTKKSTQLKLSQFEGRAREILLNLESLPISQIEASG